jgi:hypothetical protein
MPVKICIVPGRVSFTTAHLVSRGSNTGFNAEQSLIGAPLKRGTMELHAAFVAHHNKATTADAHSQRKAQP